MIPCDCNAAAAIFAVLLHRTTGYVASSAVANFQIPDCFAAPNAKCTCVLDSPGQPPASVSMPGMLDTHLLITGLDPPCKHWAKITHLTPGIISSTIAKGTSQKYDVSGFSRLKRRLFLCRSIHICSMKV